VGTVKLENGPNGADLDVNGYTNLGTVHLKLKWKLTSRTTNNAVAAKNAVKSRSGKASFLLLFPLKTPGEWIAPALKQIR
jgi:hypothetical protein